MATSVFLHPDQTRLVTIIAHVDHGKTTLADSLIESNGIISERLAGTLRYLDSLEEEQRRGITMRSSAIGLKHRYTAPPGVAKHKQQNESSPSSSQDMIIHLLDSPGHTDFSFEVSSSLQCCDGALLVVDAVEGMCARTHQVLREAHVHQLVPILIINKMDRLCTELCLTATEAYLRLRNLIENVNAASAAMLTSARHQQDVATTSLTADEQQAPPQQQSAQPEQQKNNNINREEPVEDDEQDSLWTFEPGKGNIIFASALFGWGFTVPDLARALFRSKIIPVKPVILKQCLFGDFKYRASDNKILKWKGESDEAPLFAEYALQQLWDIYEGVASAAAALGLESAIFADNRGNVQPYAAITNSNKNTDARIESTTPGMERVLAAMQTGSTGPRVPHSQKEMHTVLSQTGSNTEEAVLRSLLRRYRPLSDVVLDAVCEQCPSPSVAASTVRPRALALTKPQFDTDENDACGITIAGRQGQLTYFAKLQKAAATCETAPGGPTAAHVCKFMVTDRRHVRDPNLLLPSSNNDTNGNAKDNDNLIMGLARVLCGTLSTGHEYYLMGPKHKAHEAALRKTIRLYLPMGSDFVKVDQVPAGHLCAIYGLDDLQLKTATICDSPYGMPLRGFERGIRPLVKVNVEAVDAEDMDALERGLMKLSLADAAVEVTATSKGEHILACLGEIHLEQSILDLEKIYCNKPDIKLRISDPIVDFGETTAWFKDKQEDADYEAFYDDSSPRLRQSTIPPYNEEEGIVHARHGRTRAIVSGRCAAISLRALPLSAVVYQSLQKRQMLGDGIETDLQQLGRALQCGTSKPECIFSLLCDSVCALDGNGNAMVESRTLAKGYSIKGVESEAGEVHVAASAMIESEARGYPPGTEEDNDKNGEREDGILYNTCTDESDLVRKRIRQLGFALSLDEKPDQQTCGQHNPALHRDFAAMRIWGKDIKSSAVAGFQLAVRAGPICEEPVRNILVVLEGLEIALTKNEVNCASSTPSDKYQVAKTLSSGMVVSAIRSGVRCCLLTRPARLVERHFLLTLHSSLNGLGPLYAILSKRRGKVVEDSMVDGTDLLMITATLPQAESFGLAPELFRKSSGQVTAPELIFSHWETLDEDPFWIPTSLEEREDFGEILVSGDVSTGVDNTALKLIRQVRMRKGLLVDSSRTVVAAEKQRTRKR